MGDLFKARIAKRIQEYGVDGDGCKFAQRLGGDMAYAKSRGYNEDVELLKNMLAVVKRIKK